MRLLTTRLGKNVFIAIVSVPVLWYLGVFSIPGLQFLQTLVLAVLLAVFLSPKWPDPQMDPVSAAVINKKNAMLPGTKTHLVFVFYFEEPPSLEEAKAGFKPALEYDRFVSVPKAAKALFEASWQKVDTSLDDHIFWYTVDSEKALEANINRLTTGELRPLDPNRPLWRVDILKNSNGNSAMVWLLDHCVGDGIGLLPLGMKLMTTMEGKPYKLPVFSPRTSGLPKRNPIELVKKFFLNLKEVLLMPHGPYDSFCAINRNSRKRELQPEGPRQIATIEDFNFKDINAIKNAAGSGYTINDVFAALWAGTIRRYLERMGDPILQTPEKILIRGQAPFSMPRKELPGKVQNNMTFIVFKFAVGEKTIRDRLKATRAEFEAIKNSFTVPITKYVIEIAIKLGLDAILIDTNNKIWHRTSFVFSNVPGPTEPLKMFGKPIISFKTYYCNLVNQAILFSYAGKVSLSMVLDTDNITKPELIGQLFTEELNAMKKEFNVNSLEDKQ